MINKDERVGIQIQYDDTTENTPKIILPVFTLVD